MTPLLGHEPTLQRLVAALQRDALHHALLLEGSAGIGKRAVADRLAMAANCAADPELRPCGTCATCRQIAKGLHPDVIVLEPDPSRAARTIPVDAIREVVRQTQYHRYAARHRFVIVDPAEAMQEPAANALLKTLEEPPDGTGFLLITHNASALLPTIRSRCQRVRLASVPFDEIVGWLRARGVGEDADAAALRSQGCPGRALSLVGEGLQIRAARRDEVVGLMRAPLADVYAWSSKLTSGSRQEWAGRVDLVLEAIEDLLRDATVVGAKASVPRLDPRGTAAVDAWAAALWPDGIERCARAVQDARDDLDVYVSGKTVMDALITTLRREIRTS